MRTFSPDSQTGKPSRNQPLRSRDQQNTKSEQNHGECENVSHSCSRATWGMVVILMIKNYADDYNCDDDEDVYNKNLGDGGNYDD